ncbi:MAG: glycosyltransferase family 1 protein [Roseiflexaceae bacterium]
MRIGIDARYLSHGLVGGVHTYIAHFLPALIAQTAGRHELLLYADAKRPFELRDLPPHVTTRILPWRGPLSSIYHDLTLRRAMARDRVEVVHFPANYGFGPRGAKTVITLHDAINILPLPEIIRGHPKNPRTVGMMTYLHLCSTAAVRRADLLLTVSEHAGREIARHSGFDPRRIVAVPHAPTPDLRRVSDPQTLAEVRGHYGIDRPFVLADALKNPAVLVRAWRRLPQELRDSHRIVFFSRQPDPLPVVREAASEGIALLLLRPPREDLIALYSAAEAFVFPSWIEGFGIPILEAMTCGAPVIASDRGAIPEVTGDAALLIDAEDDAGLAAHLTRVLAQPAEAQRLRERGFARAAQFSWDQTAQRIMECYERAGREPRTENRSVIRNA